MSESGETRCTVPVTSQGRGKGYAFTATLSYSNAVNSPVLVVFNLKLHRNYYSQHYRRTDWGDDHADVLHGQVLSRRGSAFGDPDAVITVPFLLAAGFEGNTTNAVDISNPPTTNVHFAHFGTLTRSFRRVDAIEQLSRVRQIVVPTDLELDDDDVALAVGTGDSELDSAGSESEMGERDDSDLSFKRAQVKVTMVSVCTTSSIFIHTFRRMSHRNNI